MEVPPVIIQSLERRLGILGIPKSQGHHISGARRTRQRMGIMMGGNPIYEIATGWWYTIPIPLKNDGVKVSWDDEIPRKIKKYSKAPTSPHVGPQNDQHLLSSSSANRAVDQESMASSLAALALCIRAHFSVAPFSVAASVAAFSLCFPSLLWCVGRTIAAVPLAAWDPPAEHKRWLGGRRGIQIQVIGGRSIPWSKCNL